ncbi:unnamed protein product [Linum tenue]|uniref:Uncharacterized protein n=1 Tax=Linum tenue TaxID=586396 RepID=A0AAV0QEZ1_9ROSI|nr:unnamed protein product [Linum tenue]
MEESKIRKRGNSSSPSSSLVHRYRFKRAILVGKRVGSSSTPVPSWMMAAAAKSPNSAMAAPESANFPPQSGGREASVSARRLAASLWEINKVHSPAEALEDSDTVLDQKELRRNRDREKNSELPRSSDPASYGASFPETMERRRNGHRRKTSSVVTTKKKLLLTDYSHGEFDSTNNANLMEGKAQMECVIGIKTRLKDVSKGLLTSKELLKVMNRLWGLDEQNSPGISLVSALRAELDRARNQVNHLIKDQKSSRHEIIHLINRFEEEKASWRSKERRKIHDALSRIAEELEVERKLRKQSERLNKKLGCELAETKEALAKALKELESEKRAKEIMEQVCDELASGIGDDRAMAEEVKRQREEVEKEREMLLLADVLREERVQMKLSEAKCYFEEKNAAVERLKCELESRLRENMERKEEDVDGNGDGDDDCFSPKYEKIKELEAYLKEIEFGGLQKGEGNVGGVVVVDDDDGDDSGGESESLQSIELNMDHNSKGYKWNFEGITLENAKRISVDKDMKGIEWGSISLYKKDSDNVNGLKLDSDAINLEIRQILDKERRRSNELGLDSQEQGGEDEVKILKSAKSLRDFLLSNSRRESSAAETLPLQELNNGVSEKPAAQHVDALMKNRAGAGTRGERRLSTSSKQ